jgi:hypothetical protein
VTSCEPVAGHFGGFTPTVDELVAAAKALPSDVCVPRAKLEDAIRDCAANIGGTAFAIFVDDGGERGCHVAVEGGAHQDRKFVVFVGGFRIGATFDAGSTAIELGASPHVYLDSLGKDAELCPMTSSGGKATKSKPDGWDGLPADVRDFLCSGTPEK